MHYLWLEAAITGCTNSKNNGGKDEFRSHIAFCTLQYSQNFTMNDIYSHFDMFFILFYSHCVQPPLREVLQGIIFGSCQYSNGLIYRKEARFIYSAKCIIRFINIRFCILTLLAKYLKKMVTFCFIFVLRNGKCDLWLNSPCL